MIIYLITNNINGKQYVGQTTRALEKRWQEHICQGRTARSAVKSAINKYGKENFTIEQIDSAASLEELNKKEVNWISKLGTLDSGYNLHPGGNSTQITEETREKLSKVARGRKLSNETISKIVKANKGSKRSIKSKEKMSIAAKKDVNRVSHLNNISPRKKIIDNNGNIYSSISQASKLLNVSRGSIYKVLNREWKQVNNMTFSYLENNDEY